VRFCSRGSQRTIVTNKRWFFFKLLVGEIDFDIQSHATKSYSVSVPLRAMSQSAQTYTFVDLSKRFCVTYTIQERSRRSCDVLDLVMCPVTCQVEARLNKLFRAAFLY
jgi:hypothetical protein